MLCEEYNLTIARMGMVSMKVLMYGSLIIAFGFMGLYIIACYNKDKVEWCSPKRKKIILFGGALAYFVFFSLAFLWHEQNKNSLTVISPEVKDSLKRVISSSSSIPTRVANAKISVRVRTIPTKMVRNENLILQFLVTNQSKAAVKDLRMNFLEGNLGEDFLIKTIKGNCKVHLLENLIILSEIKVDESIKLQFELVPKNTVEYSTAIAWQAGNNYILGEDNKPLQTLIHVEVADEVEITEDPDFSDFSDLKPVEEIQEPLTEATENTKPAQEIPQLNEQSNNEKETDVDNLSVDDGVYEQ